MMATREPVLRAIVSAWSSESSTKWTPDNPAAGQCSVTSLLIQELLGGRILKTRVAGAWHYYNALDDGRLDLTEAQFVTPIQYEDHDIDRSDAMGDTSEIQLAALRAATLALLNR